MTKYLEAPKEIHKKKRVYKKIINPDAIKQIDPETRKEILVYKNGLVKDAKTGHTIHPPFKGRITSSERGKELANSRHEVTRKKIRDEILKRTKEANPDANIHTPEDAYSYGAGETWQKSVLEGKYPRDKINALEAIGKLGDFTPRQGQIELPKTDGVSIFASLSTDDLLALAEGLRRKNEEKKEVSHDENLE